MYQPCSLILCVCICILSLSRVVFTAESNIRALQALDDEPVMYFTLARRGGSFASSDFGSEVANLTYLEEELGRVEARFNLTKREVKGNKLVRKAKSTGVGGNEVRKLMGEVAVKGRWFARMNIGDPPQDIEVDLDMLTSDFYVLSTTSKRGSKYHDLFSQSNVKSNAQPFPKCGLPSDKFLLPTINITVPLSFAHCSPSKSSVETLGPSGSTLGLAPSQNLKQIDSPSFFAQLLDERIIARPIFSILMINGQEGVLSIGGTTAKAVELVIAQTEAELDRVGTLEGDSTVSSKFGNDALQKRGHEHDVEADSLRSDWHDGWKWSKVQGAEGWWQILMQGVYVDGDKVLKNQPVVIDISTPFILAPPLAAKAFYASISGSLRLTSSPFYIFPCLNPPAISFEFDGWQFPAMHGGKGADWYGMPGGRFSLGRLQEGSGYCVGAVVSTGMGVGDEGSSDDAQGGLAGNGMRDVWVLGEGWFRGVNGVFDFEHQKVGFRTY